MGVDGYNFIFQRSKEQQIVIVCLKTKKKIAILGGGASGIFAAIGAGIAAREQATDIDINIFEAGKSIGKPILRAGNGRCNLSNIKISVDEALSILVSRGLILDVKETGEIFPYTNRASSVLNLCNELLEELGVNINCNTPASSLFDFSDYDAVIVCTGNRTTRSLLPKSTKFSDFSPVLCPIEVVEDDLKGVENLRAKATLRLKSGEGEAKFKEFGEVQFRKYGISGIVVFNASRFASPGDVVELDFKPPAMNEEDYKEVVSRRLATSRNSSKLLSGLVDEKLEDLIVSRSKDCAADDILDTLRCLKFSVKQNHTDPKTVQVYRGGVEKSELSGCLLKAHFIENMKTSGELPQIVEVCGEAQDFDAPCGGFNISHAFNSGLLAGRDVVARLENNGNNIETCIKDLEEGKVIGIPTDTVYGVGVSVRHASSPALVNKIKRRSVTKPVAWLIAEKSDIDVYAKDVPDYCCDLIDEGWPGGLTVILQASDRAPKNFVADDGSVAIRLPACEQTRRVIKEVGSPLAVSSANFSGASAPAIFFDCDKNFLRSLDSWIIDDAVSKNSGIASTIIDCRGTDPITLRQ